MMRRKSNHGGYQNDLHVHLTLIPGGISEVGALQLKRFRVGCEFSISKQLLYSVHIHERVCNTPPDLI